jgi:hypothetical protein
MDDRVALNPHVGDAAGEGDGGCATRQVDAAGERGRRGLRDVDHLQAAGPVRDVGVLALDDDVPRIVRVEVARELRRCRRRHVDHLEAGAVSDVGEVTRNGQAVSELAGVDAPDKAG